MSFQEAREYFQELNPNLYAGCVDFRAVEGGVETPPPERPGVVIPYGGTEGKSDLPAKVVLYQNISVERIELPA